MRVLHPREIKDEQVRLPRGSGLWRHRDFLRFWAGQTISAFGTQVTFLALPLTAALVLDAGAAQMGILAAAQQAPGLLAGLLVGAWVDRHRKGPFLIAADLGRAVLIVSVPIAYGIDALRVEQLYLTGFLVGILDACFGAAYAPFLLAVVRRDRLLEANSKLSQTRTAAYIAGPGLAGALVQALSAPVALIADALSFAVSALFLRSVRSPEPAAPPVEQRQRVWREIAEGLRFVAGDRLLRALAANDGTWRFFDNVILAVFVLFVTRDLGLSPGLLGLIFAGGPVGFFLGSVLLQRATAGLGVGPVAVWGAVIGSVGGFFYVLAGGPTVVAVALLLAAEISLGFGGGLYKITTSSLRQIVTPDRLLGRMNASFNVLSGGVAPLGALAGGILGETIGLRPTLAVGAIGGMAAFLWVWFSPLRALRELPQVAEPAISPPSG